MCICILYVCALCAYLVPMELRFEGIRSSGTGVTGGGELSRRCWKSNQGFFAREASTCSCRAPGCFVKVIQPIYVTRENNLISFCT